MDDKDKEIKHLRALVSSLRKMIEELREYIRDMLIEAKK